MALSEDLASDVKSIITQKWNVREGQIMPSTDTVVLAGGAVKLSANFLYADLADSTDLAM